MELINKHDAQNYILGYAKRNGKITDSDLRNMAVDREHFFELVDKGLLVDVGHDTFEIPSKKKPIDNTLNLFQ